MKKSIATFFSIVLVVSSVAAQTPQKPEQEIAPEDILRITTSLVQTDVVVTDKNDQVIPDLKLEDFKVFENGKRQDLKFLEFVPGDGTPRVEGGLKIAGQPVEPNVERNLSPTELRRVFAFVVDDLTIPVSEVHNVRKVLSDFVDNQMRAGDLVAIIRVVGGNGLLQQFTSDKALLRRAISRISANVNTYSAFNNLPDAEKINTDLLAAAAAEGANFPAEAISSANTNIDTSNDGSIRATRSLITLTTANDVTNRMKELPGRKSLVLISGGLPLWESTQTDVSIGGAPVSVSETRTYVGNSSYLMRQLIDHASRAGVVINTMDIRGLAANGGVAHFNDPGNEATSALFGGTSGGGAGSFGRRANMAEFDNLSLDTVTGHMGLQALASSTGGISVLNSNNFSEGIQRIVNRSSYYLLAYTPSEPWDNKFRKLEIRVNRPGARVYARAGYVATAENPTAAPSTKEESIIKAAMSPLAKRGVEIAGRVQYKFLPDSRGEFDINLLINANNLNFRQDATGQYVSTFEVVGFLIDITGRSKAGFGQTVHATLSPEEYKRALTTGISYTAHAELPAGSYQLRAVVRESETGQLGSISQYLEVPDLSKKHLAASSLFLYAVDPGPGAKPNPMTALRQLPRNKDLRYAAVIYNPKLNDGKAQLRSQTFISRDGKIVYQEPETPITADTQNGQVIKIGQLGLGKAHAGRYVLTLIISDPQADKQSRIIVRNIDFELVD
jgi:VWFA-related protein